MKASKKLEKGTRDHSIILRMIKNGIPTDKISTVTGYPRQAVAALRAHITMGTYGRKTK